VLSDSGTNSPCKVFLAGGDVLEGSLVACDAASLSLQTWYAGRLKIPRASLRSVYFPPDTPDAFAAVGPQGWTQGVTPAVFATDSGEWTFRDGSFYASKSASIARDLHLPASADIQFDLAWTGELTLSVALYTDSLQPLLLSEKDGAPHFGGFYSMRFLNMSVAVARIKKNEPIVDLPPVMVTAFTQTNRAHIDVRVRKQSSTISFSVDGHPLQTWTDPNGFVGEGAGMRFVHNGRGLIKLSDLRVTPWDGSSEDSPTARPVPGQVAVFLTNATILTGQIEKVVNGKLTLRGQPDPTEIPLPQIRRITFPRPADDPVPADQGSLRGLFPHGCSLTFHLESWSPEGVALRSPLFGPARFNPDAFERLIFPPPETTPPGTHTP
jgi:hypothetical protein